MDKITDVALARAYLKQGNILAYPTEAVFGLGCDPFNLPAVNRLLALKHRSVTKGLILLISDWSQLEPLIVPVSESLLDLVRATWPGPVTWVFPKSDLVPDVVSGTHPGIAIRMSAHPLVHALCVDGPVISTSANVSGYKPALNVVDLVEQFPSGVDAVLLGDLGGFDQPSAIYDVLTGARLR